MAETNVGYWVEGGLYRYLGLGKWQYVPGEVKDQTTEDICSNTLNDNSAKADAGKPRLSLVPRKIIWAIAKIREYGCCIQTLYEIFRRSRWD